MSWVWQGGQFTATVSFTISRCRLPSNFCDIAFNIDAQVTPELTRSGRLRPFVYCWMGTLLRYWPVLLRHFKRESKASGALCRAVIMSGMSDQKYGSAKRLLNEPGSAVRDRFHADSLTAGSGGPGSVADFGSVVTAVRSLSCVVQGFSSKMDRDNALIVSHLGRVTERLEDKEFEMPRISQPLARSGPSLKALARSGPSQTPPSPATGTRSRFNNSSGSSSSSSEASSSSSSGASGGLLYHAKKTVDIEEGALVRLLAVDVSQSIGNSG